MVDYQHGRQLFQQIFGILYPICINISRMVTPSFVMSAYMVKDQVTRRQVNFRQTKLRYFVVFIACLVVFGCQYIFDNPSVHLNQIMRCRRRFKLIRSMREEFNLLYSFYALPNIVVPLLGGMLIDSKGPRIALILTAGLCVVGQAIFSFGGLRNVWFVMLIGRLIFGLGGEVLHASQNTIISRWFKASQLSMVLGICISAPKLGSSLNAIVSTKLGQHYSATQKQGQYLNVGVPALVGLGLMILSFILALVLSFIDKKTENKQRVKHESQILSSQKLAKSTGHLQNLKKTSSLMKKSGYKEVNFLERSKVEQNQKEQVPQGQGHFSFKAIKQLPITYWMLLLVAMLSQALFIPFLDNGNKYFRSIYKSIETTDEAGQYLILPYVVSTLFVIPLGFFTEKFRNRGYVLIASCAFITVTYGFMMYVETDSTLRSSSFIPWIPVTLLGICIAIFCAIIVPTVPMIVPPTLLGSGFGMMEMLQNLALSTFPLLAGLIRETQDRELQGFHVQTLFFFVISCICLASSIFLETADRFRGNKLKKKNFRKTYIRKVMGE